MLALGGLHKQREDPNGALDYLQKALTFFQQGGYGRQVLIAEYNLGFVYVELGNYSAAEQTFQQLLQAAEKVGDQRNLGFAHDGLGYVFLETERFPEAWSQFSEEYKIEQTMKAQLSLGFTATFRAIALWKLGKYDDARANLNEAFGIAQAPGQETNKDLLVGTTQVLADIALSQNDLPQASANARKAVQLAGADYKVIGSRSRWILALALARSGQLGPARKLTQEALDLARTQANPYFIAEALLALAEVALINKDAQAALAAATEAQTHFAAARQHESEWRALLIEARADESLDNKEKARELATRAESVLASLEQQWGSESFKSYLARPDVTSLRQQLSAIKGR